ncbi:MAG: aldehyde dehydrogenase family protein, partial [Planctomycetota bacterium]
YGSVFIIAPWNYPINLLLRPLVDALSAGNRVILKPSERAPHCDALIRRLIPQYFHPNEIAMGPTDLEGTRWLIQNAVDMVCYTGSTETGRSVMRDAAERPIPVLLELGGVNPAYVAADANLQAAAERLAWGKFFNAGQTCIAPNHVFIQSSVYDTFTSLLQETLLRFYGKDPFDSCDFGRMIDRRACERLGPILQQGKVLAGGTLRVDDCYCAPTLLEVDRSSQLLNHELFAPILPLIRVESLEAVLGELDFQSAPLVVYGFGGKSTASLLEQRTRSGSLVINGSLHRMASTRLPFGGIGSSGMGAYGGRSGSEAFSYERVIVEKADRFELPCLYPPYRAPRWLVRLLSRLQ